MLYEGVRGALAADNALKAQGQETRFRIRRRLTGDGTPPGWNRKCSGAGCYST
jgi:hypothetical protein